MKEKQISDTNRFGAIGMENMSLELDEALPVSSVPGYHALSTSSYAVWNPGKPYRMSEMTLVMAELSARLWKRYNGPIRLLTDRRGYDYIVQQPLAKAYDEILPVLDQRNCGINSAKYWAASKIAAFSKLPAPCAILDMDMLIWKPLSLGGETLVCACIDCIDKNAYPPSDFLRMTGGYAFPKEWREEATPLNTAFCYINDDSLKAYYTKEAFRFMLNEKETPDYWAVCMTFAEQRILGMCAEARGIRAKLLTELEPKGKVFTHVWSAKHKIENDEEYRSMFLALCRDKLQKLVS